MMTKSSTVTWPASCVAFDIMTPFPTWQSCARCEYDIKKQFAPTVVLYEYDVPRLIVTYSRIVVLSPTSTYVTSPLNLRSCGSPPSTLPTPTVTFEPSFTFSWSVARGWSTEPGPTTHPGPTMANGPISASFATSAFLSTIAVG